MKLSLVIISSSHILSHGECGVIVLTGGMLLAVFQIMLCASLNHGLVHLFVVQRRNFGCPCVIL